MSRATASRAIRLPRLFRAVAIAGCAALVSGCGGGSSLLGSSDGSTSFGSRFSQLFGSGADSKAQLVGAPPRVDDPSDLTCPSVAIREGTATYAIGLPGKPAEGSDLRYQGTIVRYARDCRVANGQVSVRLGVEGRVIVGPAGAPPSADLPVRVAVVQEGIQPKTIFTKLYNTPVDLSGRSNALFSFVAEDIAYPIPSAEAADAYVFYIGFDPNGVRPERAAPRKGKKK